MKALIVVDMQSDFVTGPLGTPEARAIVPNVVEKVRQYLNEDAKIYYTKDTHSGNYYKTQEGKFLPIKHCIPGTEGWEIVPELSFMEKYKNCKMYMKKTFGYNWCYLNAFHDEIEIVGLCTDICVISNALILKSTCPEMKIIVDASCCAGTTPERHKAALEVMKSCQIYIKNEEKK